MAGNKKRSAHRLTAPEVRSYGTYVARRMISTTVYLTPDQDRRLRLLHRRTRVPVAEYVRQGVDLVLDRYQEMLPGQLTFDERFK